MRIRRPITNNYAFLLVGLLLLFFITPMMRAYPGMDENFRLRWVCLQTSFIIMMTIGVWSLHREVIFFWIKLVAMGLSIVLAVTEYFNPNQTIQLLVMMLVLLYCLISVFVASRHVFSSQTVDRNLLYGAVCVYLLMGIIWALVYGMIGEYSPESFWGMENANGKIPFDNFIYFSFVTQASLGYGDITPLTPLTRTLACIEVIAGQFYMAILVAGLVSMYLQNHDRR